MGSTSVGGSSARQWYTTHVDGGGFVLSTATVDGTTGWPTKIETANSSLYFSLGYDSDGLTQVQINNTSGAQILDFDVTAQTGGWKRLDKVKYASAVNTIDTDTYLKYEYNSTTWNLEYVKSNLDGSTLLTLAEAAYNGSDQVTSFKDAQQNLSFSVGLATQTTVTFNVEASGNPSTLFTHDTFDVWARSNVYRAGGFLPETEIRDDHRRVTCSEFLDSRMIKFDYTNSWNPVKTDYYGKTGSCGSGGTVDHTLWHSWEYNSSRQSWRPAWTREKSMYQEASSCAGGSLPAGCRETKFEYVSSSDDRIQWATETGYTRTTANAYSQVVKKYRTYYFGLDTGTCASSGDWYSGLTCQTETQSSGGTVYEKAGYTYIASGTYAGLPKTIAFYRNSSDSTPLTTTFGSHNAFGTPTTVTSPAGVTTTYTMNGWNAPTQTVEASAILDDADSPTASSLTTGFSYNKLRAVSRVTLPKANYEDTIYYTGSTDYARVKARALLDTSANKLELMRYLYDKFGNVIEDRVLDSISGTTPCTDEDCTTYDVRGERKFNANRQVTEAYLHATDTTSPPDATQSYTYAYNQLTQVSDYRGTLAATTYDTQGRVATQTADSGGIGAQTQYAYDLHGRTATVTAPAGVITFYEYDDFGQLVIERSKTRGDIRYDYDVAGRQTKRRRTAHKSLSSPEDTCMTVDWLGRQATVDFDCTSPTEWTFYYDGASTPSSACPTASKQEGQLSMMAGPNFTRVLCYHPNGSLYGSYQIESSTWSNSTAKGTQTIYDANGNLLKEYINVHPTSRTDSRIVEYVYSSSMPDRVDYVRHKINGAGSWTYVTSNSTSPTYFAYGGMKTLTYANGITETNGRDYARRLTLRRTKDLSAGVTYTDINLTYDVNGNITLYDDSNGYRHTKYEVDPGSRTTG